VPRHSLKFLLLRSWNSYSRNDDDDIFIFGWTTIPKQTCSTTRRQWYKGEACSLKFY